MCFAIKCPNCGKIEGIKVSGSTMSAKEVGERLVKLATEPVNPYWNWCVDCILDTPCQQTWENEGGYVL
jgi:hypothetical protein